MQSQVDPISPVLVEINVEVPWERVSKALDDAYRTLQRSAQIRGFRKGKAPRNVLKNLMGKRVKGEVASTLMEEGLLAAVKEHELDLIAMPEHEDPVIEEGQPMRFKAKLEVRPKIESVDTSSLVVEQKTEEVTEQQVDDEVERLRIENADLVEPDPPRPATKGDILTLDIGVSVEGTERPEMNAADSRAELGEGALLPEIEEGLVGMQVGQSKTVEVTFPEDHSRDELKGKKAQLTLTVKEHRERQLPDRDDEFAKDLEHDSLKDLRADIRKRLEETAGRKAGALLKEAVVDALVDKNPIEVPPSIVQQQAQAMLRELFQLQQMLGQALPYDEDTHAEMQRRAERKVRAGLLFGAIADEQKLEVTDEEVEAKLAEIAEQTGKHIAKVRAEHQGEALETLKTQMLEQKLLEYLLAQATIRQAGEELPEPAEEAGAAPADERAPKKQAPKKKAAEGKAPPKKKAAEGKAPPKKKAAEGKAPPKKKTAAKAKSGGQAETKTPAKKKGPAKKKKAKEAES